MKAKHAVLSIWVLVALLTESAAFAKAAPKPIKVTRTVSFAYTGACAANAPAGAASAATPNISGQNLCSNVRGGAMMSTRKGERYVTVQILDDHGTAALQVFPNDPSAYDPDFVCGSAKSLPIYQSTEYNFFLQIGTAGGCLAAAPTTGRVILTFSNRP